MIPTETAGGRRLVRSETTCGVRTLTLDSPHNRNALSRALIGQLRDELAAGVTDGGVRVIVLSHTGRVFCSGADLTEVGEPGDPAAAPTALLAGLIAELWEAPKPVVARIGGPARAGGLGLIAAADIAICAESATFAFTEVRLGVVPAVISATVLRRLTPRAAAELYLTGDVFDGRRAAEVGLVSAAVPEDTVDATVAAYCTALVRGGPQALAGAKELLRRRPGDTVRDELAELAEISVRYFGSAEGREGVEAARAKRDPAWLPGD